MTATARRKAGPLPLSTDLRRTLVAIRAALGVTTPTNVPLASLVAVEKHLGGRLPEELIAVLLATKGAIDGLITLTEGMTSFYEAQQERNWRKRFKFNHVAFDDTYNPDEGLLCARLGSAAKPEEALIFWLLRKASPSTPSFFVKGESPFVSYCHWKYPDVDFAAAKDDEDFVVRIVGATKAVARRVKHAKFGEGVVVKEIPPDKLEIDFGALGVKKLLASIVTDA